MLQLFCGWIQESLKEVDLQKKFPQSFDKQNYDWWDSWSSEASIVFSIFNESQPGKLHNTHYITKEKLPAKSHRALIQQIRATHLHFQSMVTKSSLSVKAAYNKQVVTSYINCPDYHQNTSLQLVEMQQRYCNLNGPVSTVMLAAEFSHCGTNGGRDKIFLVLFNTAVPLASALVVGQWAVWLEAGRCRVTRRVEQWGRVPESALSRCSALPTLPAHPFFSLQQISPANRSFVLWRENTHTLQMHTHIHTLEERKKVSGGWVDCETEKKQSTVRV